MAIEQSIIKLIDSKILNKAVDTNGEQIFKLSTQTEERLLEALQQNDCILSYLNAPVPTPAKEVAVRVFNSQLAENEDGDIILDKTNGNFAINVVKVKINRVIVQVELDEAVFVMEGKALEDVILSRITDAFTEGINKKFINDLVAQGVAKKGNVANGFGGVALSALKSNNGFVLVSRAFLNNALDIGDIDKDILNNPKVHLFESNDDNEAIVIAVEDKNAIEVYKGAEEVNCSMMETGFLRNTKVFGARASYGFLVKNPRKVKAVIVTP